MQIIVATNNKKKLQEINDIFIKQNLSIEFISQSIFNISSTAEPYHTFVENALVKARYASKISGLPALADDSGLCISSFNELPSVYSSHWAEDNNFAPHIQNQDERNNAYLQHKLKQLPIELQNNIPAYYHCTLVFVKNCYDFTPIIVSDDWQGLIRNFPKGENGFGYDAYFYIPKLNKTAAELSIAEKNSISHRGLALKKLKNILINNKLF